MPVKWKKSKAKRKLRKDILAGKTEGKTARQVYETRPCFMEYEFVRFSANFYNLRKRLAEEKELADFNTDAYYNDRFSCARLPPSQTSKPHWNTSQAKGLLEQDIDAGRVDAMKPVALRASRDEYKAFDLDVFRKHIHQAKKTRANKAYWNHRRVQQDDDSDSDSDSDGDGT